MKNFIKIFLLVIFWTSFSGQLCTKKMVYSKDYYTNPWKAHFDADQASVFKTVEKTLNRFGYELTVKDEVKGSFVAGWRPVEADSHYVNLFDRRDYGVSDGAYYQLTVDLSQEGSRVKVLVATTVKSIVGPLLSSGKVEKRILLQLQDYLRSPQVEMTNVGVEKK